jgi:hypothetical protein
MLSSQILRYARVLLAGGWCQGAEARDAYGVSRDPWDHAAVAWSLRGALGAVASDAGAELAEVEEVAVAALALTLDIRINELQTWNDDPERTQAEVLAACDRAIALVPRLVDAHFGSHDEPES